MRRTTPLAALAGAAIVLAAGPGGRPAAAAGVEGPVHRFGGMLVRSLDPVPPRAPLARLDASPLGLSAPVNAAYEGVLSDERTLSRWANVDYGGFVYSQPSLRGRHVASLRDVTEDGFPEVYLLLRATTDELGHQWIKLRIPGRPNGRVGWVRREKLGPIHATTKRLVLDRRRLRMYYFDGGRQRWSAPVGIGKGSTPTPAGRFWIRERFRILNPRSGYFPYAFGTADYSVLSEWPGGGVIGIHGPYYEPQRIPGRPSHGCIRMHVSDDAWLAHHVGVGTPLQIK